MSRATTGSRPSAPHQPTNVNRPTVSTRPQTLPGQSAGNRPDFPSSRPSAGDSRPNFPNAGNQVAGNRPNAGDNRPNAGTDLPNLPNNRPDFGGNTSRPNLPSSGDGVRDFLGMPGGNTKPAARPSFPDQGIAGNRTNVGDRTNIGDRTKVGDVKVGDVNINAGNKVAISRENNVNAVRNKYTNVENRPFDNNYWSGARYAGNPNWHYQSHWNQHPGHWGWQPCNWTAFGTWFAWSAWAQPMPYNYGTNVVYRDNYIYVNDQPTVTTEVYYQQAETIAQSAPQVADESAIEWMPLGVFAIAEENGTDSGMMVQLAVSKEGIIAGTFYNDITQVSRPVEGMVDRETQRAAWRFSDGNNPEIVMETGIDNLTKGDSNALVHFGADKIQTWSMIRLPAPEDGEQKK